MQENDIFCERSIDDQDRPKFKLSKPVVVYNKNMEGMVEKVLAILVIGRGTETGFRGNGKAVKKHKLSSNLAGKGISDTESN